MTKGVQIADEALKNKGSFNGELAGSVLCVVEETNLGADNSIAYNRMKAWVTGQNIPIHAKGRQPYDLPNTTHWVQCANEKAYCPIFPGDTRITMMHVPMLYNREIPKDTLMDRLKQEAPSFLRTLLDIRLPQPKGRLKLPVVATQSKLEAEEAIKSPVTRFVDDYCYRIPGASVKFSDFYDKMHSLLTKDQKHVWTKHKVLDEFRNQGHVIFGRAFNNVTTVGNLSLEDFNEDTDYGSAWKVENSKLVREETNE